MTMVCRSMAVKAILAMLPGALVCQTPTRTFSPAERAEAARKYFTDVVLVNQDGQEMKFYSDLIEGKTIIMIPFFTTCTGVCPPMNRNLERIQDWLGDRLGKEVHLLSISVDPETDTVPRMKEYAGRFHAKPGWYFLGGKKDNVDLALKKIGQYVPEKNDHSSIMILGNTRTGLWKKAFALGKIEELITIVESVVDDKEALSSTSAGAPR